MDRKRVGVTGGTGFIGRYLLRDYADAYDFIVATSQQAPSNTVAGVEYCWTDYSEESLRSIFGGCNAVVHLASHVMHGLDDSLRTGPYVQNLGLADCLFSVCREKGITNVVNASSVAVYQRINDAPTRETDPCLPNSVYGIMKIAIEQLAGLYNRKYGMKIKTLRFGQGLGKQDTMKSGRFWSVVLNNCLEGKPVPIWGDGSNGRDLIYVKDMALAIVKALEHGEADGIYNIGTGVLTTNLDVAKAYCTVFGNEAGIEFVPDRNQDVDRAWLDCTKAREELGFVPRFDLIRMVQDIKLEMEQKS